MVISVMDFNSEAGFLQSSFVEFVKCWSMGTSSTFHVESRNGQAFLNFSAFLGQPRNVHFYNKESKMSKSERKAQRDRQRAELHRAKVNDSTSSTGSNTSSSTPVLKMKENINVDVNFEDASKVNESNFSNELENSDVIDNDSTSYSSNDAHDATSSLDATEAEATQNAGDDNDQDLN